MVYRLPTLSLSVYLPTFILSLCRGLLIPVLPVYASSFGVSYSLIGLILAGEAVGTLVADVPAGSLLRRLSGKWAMVLGISLVGLSVLGLVWAGSVWEVFGYRFLAGVGGALWSLSRHAYITKVTKLTERGRAIALFGGTNRLGVFAGPALGGITAAAYGLTAPFVVFVALSALALVVVALFTEEPEPAASNTAISPQALAKRHVFEILRHHYRVLASAGSGQLLAQMIRASASRQVIIPLYGASILGLDLQAVGLIMSVSSLIDFAMFYPVGLIMDSFGRKYAIIPCFFLQAVGMAFVPLAAGTLGLLACASVMGLGNGLGSGTMMTLGADLAPQNALGEFLGVWRLIGDGGTMGAPLAVGAIADLLSLPTAALVMAGVGCCAVGIFALKVPETRRVI
jgi:MFS family permease